MLKHFPLSFLSSIPTISLSSALPTFLFFALLPFAFCTPPTFNCRGLYTFLPFYLNSSFPPSCPPSYLSSFQNILLSLFFFSSISSAALNVFFAFYCFFYRGDLFFLICIFPYAILRLSSLLLTYCWIVACPISLYPLLYSTLLSISFSLLFLHSFCLLFHVFSSISFRSLSSAIISSSHRLPSPFFHHPSSYYSFIL